MVESEPPRPAEQEDLLGTYDRQLQLLAGYCVTLDMVLEETNWLCVALKEQPLTLEQKARIRQVHRHISSLQQLWRTFYEVVQHSHLDDAKVSRTHRITLPEPPEDKVPPVITPFRKRGQSA